MPKALLLLFGLLFSSPTLATALACTIQSPGTEQPLFAFSLNPEMPNDQGFLACLSGCDKGLELAQIARFHFDATNANFTLIFGEGLTKDRRIARVVFQKQVVLPLGSTFRLVFMSYVVSCITSDT